MDFTADYYQIQSFSVRILNYNADPLVSGTIQLKAVVDEQFNYNAQSTSPMLTNLVNTPTNNQVEFTWDNHFCDDFPNYEIQVLRLFNTDETKKDNETDISADVDWQEALTIETQSSATNITLTLAEGTGYYVWRVRPIGNFYEGGIANDKNWGMWSNHGIYNQGAMGAPGANNGSYAFFYNQFNDNINWIYSRTFTEGNMNFDEQVRISENITFANGLQQARQTQAHLSSTDHILTTQTVLDFSGRPALSSMPVPLEGQTSLEFEPNFMKDTSGTVYTAEDFDSDNNFENPGMVLDDSGEHFAYYSDDNSDITIPSAEQYPFTRSLFYNDGNSRVKEQSGVGSTFKIQSNLSSSKTNKTLYSGVTDEEIVRIFGDEAPSNKDVHKVINIDGNQTATVTYIGKDGKTLATCLAVNGRNLLGGDDPLMGLDSQDTLATINRVDNTVPYGDYGNQATTSEAFVEQTTVSIHYDLTPKAINEICLNYCATCDYFVEISIQNIESPEAPEYFHSILLPSGICNAANLDVYTLNEAVTLEPGTYIFTKRVVANNTNPVSITPTDSIGATFLETHLDVVRNTYNTNIYGPGGDLETINTFLANEDVAGLYTFLGVDISDPEALQDSVAYVTIGCDSIALPITLCEPCPEDAYEFVMYYEEFTGLNSPRNVRI